METETCSEFYQIKIHIGGGMRGFMKRIVSLLLVTVFCFALMTGCAKENTNKENEQISPTPTLQENNDVTVIPTKEAESQSKKDITIAALKGPTAMGMVKVMKDAANGETANNYNLVIAGTADEITAKLVSGEIPIAAVPCNLASVLYNKTKGGIKVAGINTLGVLYIIESGDTIKSVNDLKGKTIYSTGKGTTPEYTLNYLLSSAGIDPEKDVKVEYKSEATEVAAILSEKENAVAMLPQPFVTTVMMQNENVHIALDVTKEWEALSADESSVVTGVIVVNSKFLEENKEAFNEFLDEYLNSVNYVNNNIEEAAQLVEEFGIVKAAVAKKAMPYCNITFVEGDVMKEKIAGYLKVLYDQAPNSVGGALPEDDFYYVK